VINFLLLKYFELQQILFLQYVYCYLASDTDFDSSNHAVDVQTQHSIVTTDIVIYDDSDSEDTESFHVKLVVPSRSSAKGVRLGNQQIATIHIKDG